MSENKTHEDKITLAVASVIALALVALGVFSFISLGEKLPANNGISKTRKENPIMQNAEEALQLVSVPPTWSEYEDEGRKIDLVTSIPLFQIPGKVELIDLEKKGSVQVHPPIPNTWWLEHGVDPSYADSLQRDHDGDGFTNLEEFEAKTLPNDNTSFPELINKLVLVKSTKEKIQLNYNSSVSDTEHRFNYYHSRGARIPSKFVAPGNNIFHSGPGAKRFILDSVSKDASGGKTASITDLRRNKKLKVKYGNTRVRTDIVDYTITLRLKAVGENKKQFSLPENSRFDLPFEGVKDNGKYFFSEVKNGNAIIKYKSKGSQMEYLIPLT